MALKEGVKGHGLTCLKNATQFELVEASVKRLFAEQTISLQRLEQICKLIEMEISDFVQMLSEQQPRFST